ncbi:ankyrin repeat and protein kinase domain-containing protein 1 isoform X1 [Alosa sapidissima]|uniref:ankyrin repeat and protein kinase domain-containing protein 1 isoform X1 n=1 Tax=Alosa sapidissima TaxID=34773 RepID=UPI001C09ED35|nr:ankyrin repeat and protein kinase domain-containing protein 1 isoform X1 [Alosa sapidissima]
MASVGAEVLEKFRLFCRDDFEGDWAKVAERSFGRVYRVKLKLWRENCALKCFSNASHYRDLMEEVTKLGKVKFKYITSVYGMCNDPQAVVMEYMNKGSLDGLLSSHTLMWPKKFQMIHEIVMGMNFLHSMDPPLLHLNLKPANILLDDHLHVKISDFGVIKWEGCSGMAVMEHLTARGNISYVPPEAFCQSPDPPTNKYDVYSVAVVVWEILTQKKPYAGANMTEVIIRVSSGKRPSVAKIPDDKPRECQDMIAIMQECWQQHPKQRPAFSDIIEKTEVLSEVLKIPDVGRGRNKEIPTLPYSTMPNPKEPAAPPFPEAGNEEDANDDALESLTKKHFEKFHRSLRQEHVAMRFKDNNSLLHYTVASGDMESVRRVLGLGAQVNAQSQRGYTPLIVAVLCKLHDISALLVQQGADVVLGDEDGWAPLHFAAQNGDERAARFLLEHGAPPDATEKEQWTPLHLAAQNGHEGVARVLVARLAVIDVREGQHGRTPLHMASTYGHLGIAKLLLGKGANPSLPDSAGDCPLHLAVEEGRVRMVRLLVERGADVTSADARGHTPVHLAAVRGHTLICRYLLGHGEGTNARTAQGWTPLHLAALRGHGETVLALEAQGGEVDARGSQGWTALHLACHHAQDKVVTQLLAAGAKPDLADDAGWTPLHLAARSGCFPSALQLLSRQADVNARNHAQATPLHVAAQSGAAGIVRALLLNHASRSARDIRGHTALDIARSNGHQEAVKLLERDEER